MKTIAALLLGLWLAPSQATAPQAAPQLSRIAVVGASVSAGFGIGPSPVGGAVKLADIIGLSIASEHETPRNLATTLAYLNFPGYADRTLAELAKDPPSALIAIDYLFWSVHGTRSEADEVMQLEKALSGLASLSCPILLGDIPDVTSATVGPSPMITSAMMPSPAARDAANARIRAWAANRANVTMVPLADLIKKVNDGAEVQIRGNVWKAGDAGQRLIQGDHLHATLEGLAAIWIAAADSWLRADAKLPASALELRPATLVEAATQSLNKRTR